jgi:hypothetical protein
MLTFLPAPRMNTIGKKLDMRLFEETYLGPKTDLTPESEDPLPRQQSEIQIPQLNPQM